MQAPQYTLPHFDPMQQGCDCLVIGTPNSGKRTLSQHMIQREGLYVRIRLAETLPLSTDTTRLTTHDESSKMHARPRIDFVIFLIDMTNRASFEAVQSWIAAAGHQGSLGDGYMVTRLDKITHHTVTRAEVEAWLETVWDVPLLTANLEYPSALTTLCLQLTQLMRIATGLTHGSTSLLSTTNSLLATGGCPSMARPSPSLLGSVDTYEVVRTGALSQ